MKNWIRRQQGCSQCAGEVMQQLFTDGSETGAEITGNVVPVRGGRIWFRFAKDRERTRGIK